MRKSFEQTLMASAAASAPLALWGDAAAVTIAERAFPKGLVATDLCDLSPQKIHKAQPWISQLAKRFTQAADRGFNLTWNTAGFVAGKIAPTKVPLCKRLGTEAVSKIGWHKSFESGIFVAAPTAAPLLSILHCTTGDSCIPRSASDPKIQAKETLDPSSTAYRK